MAHLEAEKEKLEAEKAQLRRQLDDMLTPLIQCVLVLFIYPSPSSLTHT